MGAHTSPNLIVILVGWRRARRFVASGACQAGQADRKPRRRSRRGARLGPAVLAEVGGRALERHLARQAGRPDPGEAHDAARQGGQLGVLDSARVVACARARAFGRRALATSATAACPCSAAGCVWFGIWNNSQCWTAYASSRLLCVMHIPKQVATALVRAAPLTRAPPAVFARGQGSGAAGAAPDMSSLGFFMMGPNRRLSGFSRKWSR